MLRDVVTGKPTREGFDAEPSRGRRVADPVGRRQEGGEAGGEGRSGGKRAKLDGVDANLAASAVRATARWAAPSVRLDRSRDGDRD